MHNNSVVSKDRATASFTPWRQTTAPYMRDNLCLLTIIEGSAPIAQQQQMMVVHLNKPKKPGQYHLGRQQHKSEQKRMEQRPRQGRRRNGCVEQEDIGDKTNIDSNRNTATCSTRRGAVTSTAMNGKIRFYSRKSNIGCNKEGWHNHAINSTPSGIGAPVQ